MYNLLINKLEELIMREVIKQKNLIFYAGEEQLVEHLTKSNVGNVQEYIKRLILEDINRNDKDKLLLSSKADDFTKDIENITYDFLMGDDMSRIVANLVKKEVQLVQERLIEEVKKEENRIRNDYNKKVEGLSNLIKNMSK